jgi:AraC-like DNA-binding protein
VIFSLGFFVCWGRSLPLVVIELNYFLNNHALLTLVEFFYYFVVSTLVGVFGLHLVLKKGLLASKFLGLYFIVFCVRIILAYFATGGRLIQYPHFYLIGSPIHFLAPPVGFLFVYYMLHPRQQFIRWHALMFLPFLLHLFELIPFYFGPIEDKISEIHLVLKYKSLVDYPGNVTFFPIKVLSSLKVVSSFIYAVASFAVVLIFVKKTTQEFYQRNQFLLNWLLAYSSLALLSIGFIVAYLIGWIGFNNLRFSYADLLMHLAAFVNLGVVLYRPGLLDGISFKSLVLRLHADDRISEADEDAEKLKKYEGYAARLEELFASEMVFLDASLSLEKVAQKLQIPTKELSRTTAYVYELSFPDFVNTWRINYILEQRKQVEAWRNYSQDLLAEQAGFGSRQGLNNAINRLYGMTPAAYFASKA